MSHLEMDQEEDIAEESDRQKWSLSTCLVVPSARPTRGARRSTKTSCTTRAFTDLWNNVERLLSHVGETRVGQVQLSTNSIENCLP